MRISEKTRLEQIAGRRALLLQVASGEDVLKRIRGAAVGLKVATLLSSWDEVTVKVTSKDGDILTFTDQLEQFPSDMLMAQLALVAP